MITLDKSTDRIKVVLGAPVTTTELECVIAYETLATSVRTPDRVAINTNGIIDVTLLAGYPTNGVPVLVNLINVYNSDSVDAIVTIKFVSTLGDSILYKNTISPGKSIQYTQEVGFFLTDSTAGDATAANQIIGNASLSNLDANLGAKSDSAATTDTGTFSVIAFIKRMQQKFTSQIPASLGQKTMANSFPVTCASDQSAIPISGTVSTGGLTDTQLRATPVPISGTVTANTGLSQPLTDTQLRASVVPVSVSNFPTTQPISGTVAVSNFPATQPISAVSLPLPTLAATSTNQATEIVSLASIDTKLTAPTVLVYSSSAYESSAIIKNSAGQLFGFTGYNSSSSDQFIQIYNTTTVPGNGATPVINFKAKALSNFFWDAGDDFAWPLTTGICIANSSTSTTKTIGSADCLFYVKYRS